MRWPSRRSPTSPAATSRWRPATSPSSGLATSTRRRSRPAASRSRSRRRPTAVIGYASLGMRAGLDDASAWHDMTAVVRAWRGRGLAGALKRATIAWAIEPRTRDARDRQRRRQRADAGGERPARLRAAARRHHDARHCRRGEDLGMTRRVEPAKPDRRERAAASRPKRREPSAEPSAALPPDPAAYDSARDRAGAGARPRGARTSPAAGPGAGARPARGARSIGGCSS